MSQKKSFNQLIIYIIFFFFVWNVYEFVVKPPIMMNFPSIIGTLIQSVIKIGVWTVPSFLLIKKNEGIAIHYPALFQQKTKWSRWLIVALAIVVYLLIMSYIQYGNIAIRASFRPISLINAVLFVGITEELVFRGWILNSLLTKVSKWNAVILSSILFVFIHFPTWIYTGTLNGIISSGGFIQVFILGILFSWSFMKSKNIFVPMLLHMTCNLINTMFYG